VQRALDFQAAVRENVILKKELKNKYRFENIVGSSRSMQNIYHLINKVADTDSTILVQGESGTGKELVARALHFNSKRQHHPFVAVNCSALPENLLESELFGHKKGSFTGAFQDKMGLFEEAEQGTIFLDEINSMALSLQTKLLRVLQERTLRRVGDTKSIPVNVRVVAASNESLSEKTRNGKFREDLYYRLAVIPLDMPPLRDRPEDIPLLISHFLQKNAAQTGLEPRKIEAESIDLLSAYAWPGNVRELENAIERACALCDDVTIRPSDLPPQVQGRIAPVNFRDNVIEMPVGQRLEDYIASEERKYIEQTMRYNGGSREKTASMLGISMATLYRKLEVKSKRA
jgi:transcriptional regulator with PAS, ATPase and Fis domain